MNPEKHEQAGQYRPVWELDCLSRTVLLATALPSSEQATILRDCVCECLRAHLDNPAWVLMALDNACRQCNRVSIRVNRILNERFSDSIAHVSDVSIESFVNGDIPESISKTFPGYLWALLRHVDADRQEVGSYLVRDWLWRSAQAPESAAAHACCTSHANNCCGRHHHSDAKETRALEQRLAEQSEVIDRMLAYIQRTRPHRFSEAAIPVACRQP